MRKASGFTLIELVIVIVILGILGAVAAPKFINLQGDAYKANVKALAGSLQSASTLANTKAILNGFDADTSAKADSANNFKKDAAGDVAFVYGYPAVTDGITEMLQDATGMVDTGATDAAKEKANYITSVANGVLTIKPKNRADKVCEVTYKEATETAAPVITSDVSEC